VLSAAKIVGEVGGAAAQTLVCALDGESAWSRHRIGIDSLVVESDYPLADSTLPTPLLQHHLADLPTPRSTGSAGGTQPPYFAILLPTTHGREQAPIASRARIVSKAVGHCYEFALDVVPGCGHAMTVSHFGGRLCVPHVWRDLPWTLRWLRNGA